MPVRLSYIGLWCSCDREGRFKWEPRRLGASILPYDMIDFSRVLDALVTRGFIEKHASNGVDFGFIPSFTRHQVINNRESPSILPEPDEKSMIIGLPTREARVDDALVTREVQVKAEGKGREGNKEGNMEGINTPPTPTEILEPSNAKKAEEIFNAYPIKVGKAFALQSIMVALQTETSDVLMEATTAYAKAVSTWHESEKRYIPQPSNWFMDRRWEDDRSTWESKSYKSQKQTNDLPDWVKSKIEGLKSKLPAAETKVRIQNAQRRNGNPCAEPERALEDLNELKSQILSLGGSLDG